MAKTNKVHPTSKPKPNPNQTAGLPARNKARKGGG